MEENNKINLIGNLTEEVIELAKKRGQEDIVSMVEKQCFNCSLKDKESEMLNYIERYLKCLKSRLTVYHITPINFLFKYDSPNKKQGDFFFRIENFDFNTFVWAKKRELDWYMTPSYLDLYDKDLTPAQIEAFHIRMTKK
nr:MAG TPA: hypothetical protein [Caudoviricetes sp.]